MANTISAKPSTVAAAPPPMRTSDASAAPSGLGVPGGGSRLLPLDVLRAVAVILVLGNHMPMPPEDMLVWIRKPLRLWQHAGWIGVDLFFVLSGFLISGLLFREYVQHQRMRIGRFLIRRGLKIYPALYFLVAVTIAVCLIQGQLPEAHKIVGEVVFLQNYLGAIWNHTWSLAVEEHFYLSLPILLIVLMRVAPGAADPFGRLPMIFVAVALFLLAERVAMNLLYEFRVGTHMLKTHLRIDGLLFGVVLSYYYHFHQEAFVRFFRRWWWPLLLVGVLTVGPILLQLKERFVVQTIGLTLIFLLAGVLLSALLVHAFPRTRLMRSLGYMGSHSYSIYLWHYPCLVWGVPLMYGLAGGELPWVVVTPAYMAASVAIGILMAKLVEFPVLKVRDRLFPSLSRPLTPITAGPAAGSTAAHPSLPHVEPGVSPEASDGSVVASR